MRNSLFARGFAIVALAVVGAAAIVLGAGMAVAERLHLESNAAALQRAALTVAVFLPDPSGDLEGFCAAAARSSGFRTTLVNGEGTVLADSGANPDSMENHLGRPEIASALTGTPAWNRRTSATTGIAMLYAAVPITDLSGSVGGSNLPRALRLALPMPTLLERMGPARASILLAALAAVLVALAASAFLMRLLTEPLGRLASKAREYSSPSNRATPAETAGSSAGRLPAEFALLEASLDAMATSLMTKAREAESLGSRYSGILRSAGEGIIALDAALTITEANPAAIELLGATQGKLRGSSLAAASGSEAMVALARDCIEKGSSESAEIVMYGMDERVFRVVANPLVSGDGRGAVMAVSDISKLRHLERVRTDFIANVSHELRTPIQLIKGFAESMDGIIRGDGPSDSQGDIPLGASRRAELARYLSIVEKHALRMERIVSDLLSLARLERDRSSWLTVEPCNSLSVVDEAVSLAAIQSDARKVGILHGRREDFSFSANPGLIGQALSNLLENAVRYSPEGAAVTIDTCSEGDFAVFVVRDRGTGIPAPDLERIFERFYRADKSRDRKSGGTGLGLAIVRHIAMAHDGDIKAESWLGEGSVFTLRIPLAGPHP